MRDRSKSVKAPPGEAVAPDRHSVEDRHAVEERHPVEAVPAEGTNVLFDVWLVSRAATGLLDSALAPTGLSAEEFGIYSVLTSAEAMTPSELARWMSAPPTTVSSHVKRLEGRGHLVRERNPADGRSWVLRLTPAGYDAHRAAGTRFLPVLAQVVAALGPQEAPVRQALALLHTALDRGTDISGAGRTAAT